MKKIIGLIAIICSFAGLFYFSMVLFVYKKCAIRPSQADSASYNTKYKYN